MILKAGGKRDLLEINPRILVASMAQRRGPSPTTTLL
jgi:hypothetical protein